MAKLFDKVLNLVGWEIEEDESADKANDDRHVLVKPDNHDGNALSKRRQGKIVNFNANNQFKVVIMQPGSFEEARDVCDHLKSKKPVIVNLETIEKDIAQRIVDFLSGSIYALDGSIQKVSNAIFIIAPSNVDLLGDCREELKAKGMFPWMK